MLPQLIVALYEWWHGLSQTEARQRLKIAMGPVTQPKPTRHGYDVPDGREVMPNRRAWQIRADRILGRVKKDRAA